MASKLTKELTATVLSFLDTTNGRQCKHDPDLKEIAKAHPQFMSGAKEFCGIVQNHIRQIRKRLEKEGYSAAIVNENYDRKVPPINIKEALRVVRCCASTGKAIRIVIAQPDIESSKLIYLAYCEMMGGFATTLGCHINDRLLTAVNNACMDKELARTNILTRQAKILPERLISLMETPEITDGNGKVKTVTALARSGEAAGDEQVSVK